MAVSYKDQPARVMQFGTSRFLLAHVDYFLSESLAAGHRGSRIVIVQGSNREAGRDKAKNIAANSIYPVHFRGVRDGVTYDYRVEVSSVETCLSATDDWSEITERFIGAIDTVVSNVGEEGYSMPQADSPLAAVPQSFPARLTRLLWHRYVNGLKGVTLMPCELINGNGRILHEHIGGIAKSYYKDSAFNEWLDTECLWVDTLVDRIVSQTIEPVGAVAEPYGLWAIKDAPGLVLPCTHEDVKRVADLREFEWRKLHILNASHSWLVETWRTHGSPANVRFVREAMAKSEYRQPLEKMLRDEVVPVLSEKLPVQSLHDYVDAVVERFENPFLDHALVDIAEHHAAKIDRRLVPVYRMGKEQGHPTPLIDEVLRSSGQIKYAQANAV